MKTTMRSLTALALAATAVVHAAGTLAQTDYPTKVIRLIAPVPPGSPPDVVARLVAEPVGRAFGQMVIVENRPGANQTIGLGAVASALPDGYTLGMVSLPTAVVPSLMAKMPYDTLRDLAPVREIAWTSNVLVVRGDSELSTVQDLVAAAKRRAGGMTFASGGNGTPAHVMGELFRAQAGFDATHVPFKGAADGVTAVIAGHVDYMLASAGAVIPYVRAGKLKPLAQTTQSRLPALPAVATFAEQGFSGVTVRDWQGIVAPAGTPAPILKRVSDAIRAALARPETQASLRALAIEPVESSDPEQFGQFFASEVQRWGFLAKVAGLQVQ